MSHTLHVLWEPTASRNHAILAESRRHDGLTRDAGSSSVQVVKTNRFGRKQERMLELDFSSGRIVNRDKNGKVNGAVRWCLSGCEQVGIRRHC